jgi:DNA-binding transcriptional regulator YhcF (GntR family)
VHVRTDLSVPLGTQLFWQLRYAIATGEYQPGERLPTVREMAAALRVNANTIRAVYARLQDEGWVVARRKVGTVVADPPPRAHDDALEAILDRAFDAAAGHGVSSDELAAAAFARAAQRAAVGARRLLFVECGANEAACYAEDLTKALGDRVESIEATTIPELPARLAEGDVDAVVTTAHHAEEVRPLAAHLPVVSLMPSPEFLGAVAEVTRLRPGTRVGVPNPCRTPRRNVVSTLHRLGHELEIVESESATDPAIADCDVVVIFGLQDRVPGKRNLRWSHGVDQAAVVHVRRQLGL